MCQTVENKLKLIRGIASYLQIFKFWIHFNLCMCERLLIKNFLLIDLKYEYIIIIMKFKILIYYVHVHAYIQYELIINWQLIFPISLRTFTGSSHIFHTNIN